MGDWKPDRILKLLVFWFTYLLVFSWLPLVRILMDGETYIWGTTHFSRFFRAAGWEPDAWLLVLKSALFMNLIYLALRGAGSTFRVLLTATSVILMADIWYQVINDPSGFEFHGDTLGVHLNLGWSVAAVFTVFSVLGLYWAFSRYPRASAKTPPVWTARNKHLMTLWFLLLPIQFVLLRFGEPHATTDEIGVILTIAQTLLFAFALYPRSPEREDVGSSAELQGSMS